MYVLTTLYNYNIYAVAACTCMYVIFRCLYILFNVHAHAVATVYTVLHVCHVHCIIMSYIHLPIITYMYIHLLIITYMYIYTYTQS